MKYKDKIARALAMKNSNDIKNISVGAIPLDSVTDDKLKSTGIKATVTQNTSDILNHTSQLANNVTQLVNMPKISQNYLYNIDALKKSRGNYFNALVLGDSIGEGDGSTGTGYGFIQALINGTQYKQGYQNQVFKDYYNYPQGWTLENSGIASDLVSGISTNSPLDLFVANTTYYPQVAYSIKIYYSTRPDGGTSNVVDSSGTVLGTINCNGTTQDGLVATFAVSSGKGAKVNPPATGKTYINGARIIYTPTTDTTKEFYIESWCRHGRKSTDLTFSQIQTMLTKSNDFNLFIYELISNDLGASDLVDYMTNTTNTITQARLLGMDVLIVIPIGSTASIGAGAVLYQQFKTYLYGLALSQGCAILDYDNYFGGNANSLNMLNSDGIHPTNLGYAIMSDLICNLFLRDIGTKNIYTINTQHNAYGYKYTTDNYYYPNNMMYDLLKLRTYNKDGWGYNYLDAMPIIPVTAISLLPKNAKLGLIASVGTTLYINTALSESVTAVWTPITTLSNTTANRPVGITVGQQYFDTTLSKPIWLKTIPSIWVDATGTTV